MSAKNANKIDIYESDNGNHKITIRYSAVEVHSL